MSSNLTPPEPERYAAKRWRLLGESLAAPHHIGPAKFSKPTMSRRHFLQTAAGVTGAALGSGFWLPSSARATSDADPKPIPGGFNACGGYFIHHFEPPDVLSGREPSHITDFHGLMGRCNITGTGMGTDTSTGEETPLFFGVDVGFTKGVYIGEDGRRHRRTYAFL